MYRCAQKIMECKEIITRRINYFLQQAEPEHEVEKSSLSYRKFISVLILNASVKKLFTNKEETSRM